MSTLDYRAYYHHETPKIDPIHPQFEGPAIFLFWHEYIPFPFYLRGNCNIAMLLSQHEDAEWLSEAARHMGFRTIRGSTNRGGVAAIRKLLRTSRSMNLAITPDGPRGPRRKLAPGAVFLASKLGIPIITAGFGYDRPWRINSTWDRFAIPRPYSRARGILGPAISIAGGLGRDGLEEARRYVEEVLNSVTAQAESWATTGHRVCGELPLRREPAPIGIKRKPAA
jgi:lysophospholipid acyltransferase (LPLAT)-like uncharacterized protein